MTKQIKKRNLKAKEKEQYDILITSQGNIYVQPYGELLDNIAARLKASEDNKKLNLFCG